MLTGEIAMTGGSASVGGSDIATDLVGARRHMGYTPQYDGLIPFLTGRDHLVMYGRLRGIPLSKISEAVARTITNLDLEKHADNLAGSYSGGNKRKLRCVETVHATLYCMPSVCCV
jgi:ABC-type multidrug transport system ATPase subunit